MLGTWLYLLVGTWRDDQADIVARWTVGMVVLHDLIILFIAGDKISMDKLVLVINQPLMSIKL